MSFSGFTLVFVGCGRCGLVIESILFVELQGLWIAFWAIDTIGYIFIFGSFVSLDFVFT